MYCPHCGKELDEGVAFCPYCGKQVGEAPLSEKTENKDEFYEAPPAPAPAPVAQSDEKNVVALVGFILSFIVPLAGLICSCIGLKKCKELGDSWRGFAVAGIIISAVSMAITFISLCIGIPLYLELLQSIINSGYYY